MTALPVRYSPFAPLYKGHAAAAALRSSRARARRDGEVRRMGQRGETAGLVDDKLDLVGLETS